MPVKIRTPISNKIRIGSESIEFTKDKIRRLKNLVKDISGLAKIIHTNANSLDQRRAFILIFNTIKWSQNQKIVWSEIDKMMNAHNINISPKTLSKVRVKMVSIGIIEKREGDWQFSSRFIRELIRTAEFVSMLMMTHEDPIERRDEEKRDWEELFFADAEFNSKGLGK